MLNVHPSLIPRWRGAAPIERRSWPATSAPGSTIMRVTEGLDSGPVALQEEVAIGAEEGFETSRGAARRARAASCWSRRSTGWTRDELEFTEQDEERRHLRGEDRRRGATPRSGPARRASWRGRCARSTRTSAPTSSSRAASASGCARRGLSPTGPPQGEIEPWPRGRWCSAAATGGAACSSEVQPPGKRPMPAGEYLRGHEVPVRERLARRYSRHMAR